MKNDVGMMSFLIYFRKQFIAGDQNPDPVYSINFWNCYYRLINSIPKTINKLENGPGC